MIGTLEEVEKEDKYPLEDEGLCIDDLETILYHVKEWVEHGIYSRNTTEFIVKVEKDSIIINLGDEDEIESANIYHPPE